MINVNKNNNLPNEGYITPESDCSEKEKKAIKQNDKVIASLPNAFANFDDLEDSINQSIVERASDVNPFTLKVAYSNHRIH